MSNAQHRYRPIAHECEVAVIGGGPAGAAVARLLALWGRDVVLVTAPSDPTRDLAVSLPPSVAKLLAEIGVLDAVDAAGFVRSTGNTVWWGDKEPRSRAFADGTAGYQVRHRDFDRVLLAAAEAAGAKVIRDATVREADVERQPTRLSGDVDGVPFTVDAAMVLDASGPQGVVAKARGRRVEAGARTIALVGTWHRDGGWEVPGDSHTLVESFTAVGRGRFRSSPACGAAATKRRLAAGWDGRAVDGPLLPSATRVRSRLRRSAGRQGRRETTAEASRQPRR